jgi:8-oxo-dGTP diphosphatase
VAGIREWLVGGAVIEDADGRVLLVRNRRRNGSHDWSTPGGVIDEGETLLEGLAREVAEETGLVVGSWQGPLYRVTIHAPDLGWLLRVEAWAGTIAGGALRIDDPDGIVVDARFVECADCALVLADTDQWVREPLLHWLDARGAGYDHGYDLAGADRHALVVTRR